MTDKKPDNVLPMPAKQMQSATKRKLLDAAVEIMGEDAVESGDLGYLYTVHANCYFPRKPIKQDTFEHNNGPLTMHMQAGVLLDPKTKQMVKQALPSGGKARMATAFINTAIKHHKSTEIDLGRSWSDFVKRFAGSATGGKTGSLTMWRQIMNSLAATHVTLGAYADNPNYAMSSTLDLGMVRKLDIFFSKKHPEQMTLLSNTLTVHQDYFDAVTKHAMPVDMRALSALLRDPLAMDIYLWLCFRLPGVRRTTTIGWGALYGQFGSGYSDIYSFKRRFLQALKKAKVLYPQAQVSTWDANRKLLGITIKKSPPAIKHQEQQRLF